jgi:plasmid stabilization system protein ParE
MKIRYHALARDDIADILQYYKNEAGHEVAVESFEELYKNLRRIAASPQSFPVVRGVIRRCLFSRFPYQINYEIVGTIEIKILAVKHQHRDPDLGIDR